METTEHKPAGTLSYTCSVVRGRGSKAPTFDSWGDTEADAIRSCLEKAGNARIAQLALTTWTADGKGFTYCGLGCGHRVSLAKAREIMAEAAQPEAGAEIIATLRQFIEHAPAVGLVDASDLAGWAWADGVFLCAPCAGRIMARGCHVPDGASPVWMEEPGADNLCCCCGHAGDDAQRGVDDLDRDYEEEADAFALVNDPPAHRPARFDNGDKTAQRVLVEGMDCLPGQMDLF